jgi:hypothetical protein
VDRDLKQSIKDQARQLGFFLAGVTLPEAPPHYSTFENWLAQGHHGTMDYLATERSRARRASPREIMPECKSILVLATPYVNRGHDSATFCYAEVWAKDQTQGFVLFEVIVGIGVFDEGCRLKGERRRQLKRIGRQSRERERALAL